MVWAAPGVPLVIGVTTPVDVVIEPLPISDQPTASQSIALAQATPEIVNVPVPGIVFRAPGVPLVIVTATPTRLLAESSELPTARQVVALGQVIASRVAATVWGIPGVTCGTLAVPGAKGRTSAPPEELSEKPTAVQLFPLQATAFSPELPGATWASTAASLMVGTKTPLLKPKFPALPPTATHEELEEHAMPSSSSVSGTI